MRVFLDTNVLASGIGTRGLCSELLDLQKIANLPIVSPRQFWLQLAGLEKPGKPK